MTGSCHRPVNRPPDASARIRWFLAVATALAVACAGTPDGPDKDDRKVDPPPTSEPAATGPVTVSLVVEALRKGKKQSQPLEAGAKMRDGDRLALHLQVDQPAYLWVFQASPSGDVEKIFPKVESARRVEPDLALRIPRFGRWLQLGGQHGRENLLVVASPQRVPEAVLWRRMTAELARDPDPARSRRKKVRHRYRPKPATAGETEKRVASADPPPGYLSRGEPDPRGFVEVAGDGLRAEQERDGVAVIRFWLRHE